MSDSGKMTADKSPDWLPPGWIMEVRVRKDGRKDKYYIHLNTRNKVRSKSAVICCHEMGMPCDHMPQKSKNNINLCTEDKNMQLAVQLEDSLECLPKGWTVEVKTRKRGNQAGMEYKCYIAPLTGCKFYSKKAVSRYLKSGKLNYYTSTLKNRGIEVHSTEKVVQTKETVEGLPPGWIQEIKVRMTGDRRDSYYIDPVNGYVFRSKREVFRYLDTGEVGRRVKIRGINQKESIDREISLPAAAKRQKQGSSTRRHFSTGKSSRSYLTVKDEQILEPLVIQEKNLLSLHTLDQFRNGGECSKLSGLGPLEAEGSNKRKRGKKVCAEKIVVSTPPAAGVLPEKQLQNAMKNHGNQKSQRGSSKYEHNNNPNFSRRASKQLAAIKAEPIPDDSLVKTGHSVKLEAGLSSDFTKGNFAHGASELLNQIKNEPEAESIHCASKRTKELLESAKPLNEGGHFVDVEEKPKKPLEDQENPENHIESVKKADVKQESPINFPFGDLRLDPCLEFAFKTLTGVIPVEDEIMIQDYFQPVLKQNTSISSLPDLGMGSLFQSPSLEGHASTSKLQESQELTA